MSNMGPDFSCGDNSQPLEAFIRHEIIKRGGISFAEYMQHCLYHPQWGYYVFPRQRIGSKGDFFTSSSVHRLFGRLIAVQLVQFWQLLGQDDFTIVEQGAGEGELALDILDALCDIAPQMYHKLCYVIIEISPDNRQRQSKNLAGHGAVVRWSDFGDVHGVVGCFLSNELVDAFAVSVFEKHAGQMLEVFVVEKHGVLTEELRPPLTDAIAQHFTQLAVEPVEGNRAEVCLDAADWMQQVAAKLERGFVLTIDYGYPAPELYAPFRRHGTLLCYHHHQANDNPYQYIGCQDITSHVDFTLLQKKGAEAGLDLAYFAEQYRFLIGLGFVEELLCLQAQESDERKALALRMTLKNLIMPDGGMGETFKVLIQSKNVTTSQLLCARSMRDVSLESIALSV